MHILGRRRIFIKKKSLRIAVTALLLILSLCICACDEIPDVSDSEAVLEETVEALPSNEPEEAPEVTPSPEPTPEVYLGEEIAEFAKQFVGYKYVYSGKTPETGFDCSGLIYYVYRQFGYRLNRVAADQATNGNHVEYDELLPGDILCFSSGSYIGHVGLYLGDGKFIHAMDTANGVVITDLDYWLETRNLEARRIIGYEQQYSDEEMKAADELDEKILEQQRQEEELKRLQEEAEKKKLEDEENSDSSQNTVSSTPSPDPNHIVIIDDPSLKYKGDEPPVQEESEPEPIPESQENDYQPETPQEPIIEQPSDTYPEQSDGIIFDDISEQ